MPFLLVLPHADFAIVMDSVRRSHRVIVGVGRRFATSIVIELVADDFEEFGLAFSGWKGERI